MNIPEWLFNYAKYVINEYDFDSSHDLTHFQNVCKYAEQIIESDYPTNTLIEGLSQEDGLEIVFLAAFSHDLIDDKYMNTQEGVENLKEVYLNNNYPEEYLDIIILLITNMSFSKQRFGKQNVDKKYQLALDIIGDADKLDAYRVERVVAYQQRKNNDPEVYLGWIKTILVKRVLKYKDCWLRTNYAKRICVEMHEKVEEYVNENLNEVEMFDY